MKVKEIEEFFASRTKPSFARTLKQSIERVIINANWVQSIQKEKDLAAAVEEVSINEVYFSLMVFSILFSLILTIILRTTI